MNLSKRERLSIYKMIDLAIDRASENAFKVAKKKSSEADKKIKKASFTMKKANSIAKAEYEKKMQNSMPVLSFILFLKIAKIVDPGAFLPNRRYAGSLDDEDHPVLFFAGDYELPEEEKERVEAAIGKAKQIIAIFYWWLK